MNEEQYREFMLQQQAQSAARIAQLEDLLVQFARATRERFAANDLRAEEADQRAQALDEKFAALVDAQIRAEDRAAEIDRKIAALVDAHMRTEEVVRKAGERIDNLTATVDRHIADGHGGRARTEG